jgi:hypothetical protein
MVVSRATRRFGVADSEADRRRTAETAGLARVIAVPVAKSPSDHRPGAAYHVDIIQPRSLTPTG